MNAVGAGASWRNRLRHAVKASGLRHSVVARRAGIAPETLCRVLNSGHVHPQFSTVVRIARAARVSVGWLLNERGYTFTDDQVQHLREAAAVIESATGGFES